MTPFRDRNLTLAERSRSLNYHISSKDYDLYALQGEIETFCEKHILSKKVSDYLVLISEEVLCLLTDFSDINLSLSYSEKDGSLEFVCDSGGDKRNPLEEGVVDDDIGLLLIRSRCKSIEYTNVGGRNILTLIVKN